MYNSHSSGSWIDAIDLLRRTGPLYPPGQPPGQQQPKGIKGLWARIRTGLARIMPKRR